MDIQKARKRADYGHPKSEKKSGLCLSNFKVTISNLFLLPSADKSGSGSKFYLIIYFLDFPVGLPGSEFPGESREDWGEDERCKLYPLLSSSSNRNSLNPTSN